MMRFRRSANAAAPDPSAPTLIGVDDGDFVELVRRTSAQGIRSVRYGIGDVGNLLSSAISLAAAIVTAGLLNPVLAPVVLLAAVPNGWASVRSAMLGYESFVRMVSRMRRLGITSDMITSRRQAAEVRAFTTQGTLLGEHRRIGSQLAAEAVAVEHRGGGCAELFTLQAWAYLDDTDELSRLGHPG